jgi:signal peptidase I
LARRLLLAALVGSLLSVPSIARLRRSLLRVAVEGHSMEPTLRPGDWLLVDGQAYRRRGPRTGELVVVADPREPSRWLVKRVRGVLPNGRLTLGGDHPAHLDEEQLRSFDCADVLGRPWLRYWPRARWGRLS